jgi:hypothetical protein
MLFFFYCVWSLITVNSFRYKFFYFYLLLLAVSVWGFFFSLEGLIFLLLLGELLIILLFVLIYLTIQFYSGVKTQKTLVFMLILLIPFFFMLTGNLVNFNYLDVYSNLGKVVSDDFFIFFFFFFVDFYLLVYLIGAVLTIFSIFFILFYFSCKSYTNSVKSFSQKLYILRKQQLVHQSSYKPKYVTFQK